MWKPTCKCANGKLHGPFNWIYQRGKGEKPISTSCRADKVEAYAVKEAIKNKQIDYANNSNWPFIGSFMKFH